MKTEMISIQHLSKRYGGCLILNDISQVFYGSSIYGLVGANGCGKTTLMRCICGLARPSSGTVLVLDRYIGKDCDFSPSTGVIIETPGFLPQMTGKQNLALLAGMTRHTRKQRLDEVICLVGLDPSDKKTVAHYSLGMRQRLGIAQALLDDPQIIILDEPFNGLDQEGVTDIHRILQEQKSAGKCVILASHSAGDIEKACDMVFEIKNGRMQRRDSSMSRPKMSPTGMHG